MSSQVIRLQKDGFKVLTDDVKKEKKKCWASETEI